MSYDARARPVRVVVLFVVRVFHQVTTLLTAAASSYNIKLYHGEGFKGRFLRDKLEV